MYRSIWFLDDSNPIIKEELKRQVLLAFLALPLFRFLYVKGRVKEILPRKQLATIRNFATLLESKCFSEKFVAITRVIVMKTISLIEDRSTMQFVSSWLERYYFEKYILDVSIATLERGGVTSKVDTYQFLAPIDAWGFPKYPGLTRILDPGANIAEALVQFIQENNDHLREADAWLGTWMNPSTRNCHIDVTTISPGLEEARQEAIKRGRMESRTILALYNFKYDQTVFL